MLGFVKTFLGSKASPIGVDFGSDSLKLAQVAPGEGGEYRLAAAASADIPIEVRHDPAARMAFFVKAVRDLTAHGGFVGRSAVLSLPANSIYIQHLRVPKLDDDALRKALPWECRGKLPIDPAYAVLRHAIAGEVYQDQEVKLEVIVMAVARDLVNQFLATATKAKLDVVGMNVDPMATIDCFAHVHRRKGDAEATTLFVDIGYSGSRAFVARGGRLLFARAIPVGGDQLTRAVANALSIGFDEAKLLRLSTCNVLTAATVPPAAAAAAPAAPAAQAPAASPAREAAPSEQGSFALLNAALAAAGSAPGSSPAPAPELAPGVERRGSEATVPPPPSAAAAAATAAAAAVAAANADPELVAKARQVELACREPLNKMIEELELCRRYYEAVFPSKPIDRMVFVGGEARHRNLCQYVARSMQLAAQVGDPLVRMSKLGPVPPDSGIERGQPQPNWAVAIGLSMGPGRWAARKGEAA